MGKVGWQAIIILVALFLIVVLLDNSNMYISGQLSRSPVSARPQPAPIQPIFISCSSPQEIQPAGSYFFTPKGIDIYNSHIIFTRLNLATNNHELLAYDLGPNQRLDLNSTGSPALDDRGPILLDTTNNIQTPKIYRNTIVYAKITDLYPASNNFLLEIMRYDIGLDGRIGTGDDINLTIATTQISCPGTTCGTDIASTSILHNTIAWWQLQTPSNFGGVGDAYYCSLNRNGQTGGCLPSDTKYQLFANRNLYSTNGVSKLFALEINSSMFNSVWSEFNPYPSILTATMQNNNITQFIYLSGTPSLWYEVDDLSSITAEFLYGRFNLATYQRPLFKGIINSNQTLQFTFPQQNELDASGKFSSDENFIVWVRNRFLGTYNNILLTPNQIPYQEINVSQDNSTYHRDPAMSGNNVVYVKEDPSGFLGRLFLTSCS